MIIRLTICHHEPKCLILFYHFIPHKYAYVFNRSASVSSYKIGVVGDNWLVGWLVCNAIFSDTALRIFLIFCMKLGDYKDRKVTEPDF